MQNSNRIYTVLEERLSHLRTHSMDISSASGWLLHALHIFMLTYGVFLTLAVHWQTAVRPSLYNLVVLVSQLSYRNIGLMLQGPALNSFNIEKFALGGWCGRDHTGRIGFSLVLILGWVDLLAVVNCFFQSVLLRNKTLTIWLSAKCACHLLSYLRYRSFPLVSSILFNCHCSQQQHHHQQQQQQ